MNPARFWFHSMLLEHWSGFNWCLVVWGFRFFLGFVFVLAFFFYCRVLICFFGVFCFGGVWLEFWVFVLLYIALGKLLEQNLWVLIVVILIIRCVIWIRLRAHAQICCVFHRRRTTGYFLQMLGIGKSPYMQARLSCSVSALPFFVSAFYVLNTRLIQLLVWLCA